MNDQQTQMIINQAPIMNQPLPPLAPPPQVMSQHPQLAVQSQPLLLNRGYNTTNKQPPWPLLQQNHSKIGSFGPSKPRTSNNNKNNNNNWKGKKISDKRNKQIGMSGGQGSAQGYNPPALHELQSQSRQQTRKFYPNKKKFNNNNNNRFAPYAPRNTTSFIIRAKKSGGIASLVSPCPVTPAVLPTPIFSPSREVLGDMAKEEWGVDGYGSMKGLIRLRSGNEHEDEEDDEANGSSESDVEEHVEVERRLDHDLSRFEMICPNYNSGGIGGDYNNVLENRVDDQDSHIAKLEEENFTLKERLFLLERELADLRRRMQFLERQNDHHQYQSCVGVEDANEGIVESGSENESENGSTDVPENKEENNSEDVCMEDTLPKDAKKGGVARYELVDDSVIRKEDRLRKIEVMDNEMGVEDVSKDEQKQTVKDFEEDEVNVAVEKKECEEKQVSIERIFDGKERGKNRIDSPFLALV